MYVCHLTVAFPSIFIFPSIHLVLLSILYSVSHIQQLPILVMWYQKTNKINKIGVG